MVTSARYMCVSPPPGSWLLQLGVCACVCVLLPQVPRLLQLDASCSVRTMIRSVRWACRFARSMFNSARCASCSFMTVVASPRNVCFSAKTTVASSSCTCFPTEPWLLHLESPKWNFVQNFLKHVTKFPCIEMCTGNRSNHQLLCTTDISYVYLLVPNDFSLFYYGITCMSFNVFFYKMARSVLAAPTGLMHVFCTCTSSSK